MEEKTVFKNKLTIDIRVLTECQKKIDKTRFYKLIKMLNLSVSADSLHPELMQEHDSYFEPRTDAERDFWMSCRNLAKKDMEGLIKKAHGGINSAEVRRQKKLTEEEKQQGFQKAIKSVGSVGKDEVIITQEFELPKCDYFDSYRKTYTPAELKKVTEWLKKTKLNEKVDYIWIGKQIQNFKKRTTGKIF